MNDLRTIVALGLLTLTFGFASGQTVDDIVKKIASVNELQDKHIGFAGSESEQYKNFELLKSKADIDELLKLIDNKNSVVACYAAFALVDKSYNDLSSIYLKFLNNDKEIATFSGCIKSNDKISSEFYHHYWNSVNENERENDKQLFKLDSITLYRKKSYWLLIARALENRVYPLTFNAQIEYLAFEKVNNDAIFYLSNWYKAQYKDKIEQALLLYLKQTDFKNTGTTDYYQVIAELFKFRDPDINKKILEKLKTDKHWTMEKQLFIPLLQDNGIYESDIR